MESFFLGQFGGNSTFPEFFGQAWAFAGVTRKNGDVVSCTMGMLGVACSHGARFLAANAKRARKIRTLS